MKASGPALGVSGGAQPYDADLATLATTTPGATGLALLATATAEAALAVLGTPAYSIPTTNLVVDLDADEGITIATGVSAWASQVGSLVAAQATGSKQPTVKEWGHGGHDCISFDGTDDSLVIPYAAANNWSVMTLYIVYRLVPSSSNTIIAGQIIVGRPFATTATSPFFEWSLYSAAATGIEARFDGTSPGGATFARSQVYGSCVSYTVGAAGSSVHQDGYRTITAATTSITYTNNIGIGIGATALTVEQEFARMDVARILIYDVQHTPAQRHEVLMALRELYGTEPLCRSETI